MRAGEKSSWVRTVSLYGANDFAQLMRRRTGDDHSLTIQAELAQAEFPHLTRVRTFVYTHGVIFR